ncbi:MAG: hypothetical protein ACLFST_14625 [Spirochaetia bacterium]
MKKIFTTLILVLLLAAVTPVFADTDTDALVDQYKGYLNKVAGEVKAETDPAAKREVLDGMFNTLLEAVAAVEAQAEPTGTDAALLEGFAADVAEYQDQLSSVSDGELDNFSTYVVQEAEQADPVLYIGTSTAVLLLIILIIILV